MLGLNDAPKAYLVRNSECKQNLIRLLQSFLLDVSCLLILINLICLNVEFSMAMEYCFTLNTKRNHTELVLVIKKAQATDRSTREESNRR